VGILAVLAAVCGLGSGVARAVSVTYNTSGVFSSTSGSTITSGGVTIVFTGANFTVNADTNSNLGTFAITGVTPFNGNFSDSFKLTVTQSVPTPGGSMAFGTGTLSGIITVNSSQAYIDFAEPLTIQIGSLPPVTYSIIISDTLNPGRVTLNPPGQDTTVQGRITAVPVPAAAWMGLSTLAGLAGMGLVRRRRSA